MSVTITFFCELGKCLITFPLFPCANIRSPVVSPVSLHPYGNTVSSVLIQWSSRSLRNEVVRVEFSV